METDMRGQGIEATMLVAIYTLPTRPMIEFQKKKAKKEMTIINGYNRIRYINQYRRII